jgi:hypothetical protein
MRAEAVPAEPWRSFLQEPDGLLKGPVELRCLGGFVVTQQYGIGRETSDVDFVTVVAQSPDDDVEALAGLGSKPVACLTRAADFDPKRHRQHQAPSSRIADHASRLRCGRAQPKNDLFCWRRSTSV